MMDWNSDETWWMVNPRLSEQEQKAVRFAKSKAPKLDGHIWIRSSGTTSSQFARWVALNKAAFLASAQAVNDHLASTHTDIWVRALPIFHVGGLAIGARAFLSGAQVLEWDQEWEPETFYRFLADKSATLLSLVPTQLFDLVALEQMAPPDLRAVIVGGAALDEALYFRARELNWPVLPSYGMTEAASQVATAPMASLQSREFPWLKILSHIQPMVDETGCFRLLSPCLMTMALLVDLKGGQVQLAIRDKSAYFPTQDLVEVKDGSMKVLGRKSQMVKILGEQVSLQKLNEVLSEEFSSQSLSPHCCTILPVPDARKGVDLVLATECDNYPLVEKAVQEFNQKVENYERLSSIYYLPVLPRTDLEKIKVYDVLKKIGMQ